MPTFTDDIPGIRDLQWEDGSPLPRRSLLTFVGAVTVTDNPATGSTDITFDTPEAAGQTATYVVSGNIVSFYPEEPTLRLVRMVRFDTTADTVLHAVNHQGHPQMMFVNVGVASLTIPHDSAGASNELGRFLCPGGVDYVLEPGFLVEVVRDDVSERWRVVR
jgi:hypothetical protein